jgi:hypothetical protein
MTPFQPGVLIDPPAKKMPDQSTQSSNPAPKRIRVSLDPFLEYQERRKTQCKSHSTDRRERSSSLLHDLRQPRVVALSRIHQVGVDSSTHIARIFGHCDLHGIRCHHGRLWCDSSNRWSATSRIIQCNGVPLCRQCSATRSSLRKSLLVKAIGRSVFIVRLRWIGCSFISASFLI